MDQMKYVIYACLMIGVCMLAGIFISVFLSNEANAPQSGTVVDRPEQNGANTVKSKGQTLFQQNCQSCHALDKDLTGPALRGVEERGPWTDRANLIKWVKNPAAFIPTSSYTKALKQKFGGVIMPSFPQLSDEELHAIFEYITKYPVSESIAMK